MILYCSFEENRALTAGTDAFLRERREQANVLAPPMELAAVEDLARRLGGDMSVATYHELESIETGLEAVTGALLTHMDSWVLLTHPAAEEAVNAYFDYAHARTVLARARELKAEMAALIELMTGAPVNEETARSVSFPD